MTPLRIAFVLAALCGVAAWQVSVIPQSLMQMTVGATLVPAAVVAGLAVLTLLYGISAWRGGQTDESLEEGQTPLPGANRRLLFLLGGGLAFMGLVLPLGFILPATLCGMGVARAFDAPLNLKSFSLCGLIAAVFWGVFAHVLGVGLGPGLPWLI
ncbi:MAG: tripartite tricarboxylate transporter TctB family protein [Limnohabitans sp.]|jgi:Tripartite tricarboxylate transporter TctB family